VDDDLPIGWWVQRLEGARTDAGRIAAELVAHGHLSAEQAALLEGAVASAITSGRDLLAEARSYPARLGETLRRAARAAAPGEPGSAGLAEQLERLDARVARLERALARMGSDDGDGD
jgi:hypothetical protein